MNGKDEYIIWNRFKAGDESSLIYIYRNYYGLLFNYGCQVLSEKETVQDCIQELFIYLIDNKSKLGNVRSIKAYLIVSLRRRLLKSVNKSGRTISIREEDSFAIEFIENSTPLLSIIAKEKAEQIQNVLNRLSVQQREIILLYFYEGFSYIEISEVMEIKVKSARELIYRAIKKIQILLSK